MANIKAESNALTLGELLTSKKHKDPFTKVLANLSVESLLNLRLTNKHLQTAVNNFIKQKLEQEVPGELESLGENPTINNILLLYKQVEPLIECKEYFSKLSNSDSDKILKTHCLAYLICKYPSNTKAKDYFIENGADLNTAEELLQSLKESSYLLNLYLKHAFTWDSLFLLKTVLLLGADYGRALIGEAKAGKTEKVKLLLAANKQTEAVNAKDKGGTTALMWAAYNGHIEEIQALLTHNKIDVNATDNYGKTALMWAAERGHSEAVKALLAHNNVDANAKNNDGETLLIWAACHGQIEAVQALLAHNKIDVNAKNKNGETSLMWAAFKGHTKAVQALLAHNNVDVNAKDNNSWTPLMWAACHGHLEAVQALLAHNNVDVNAKNKNGETSLMWAARHGHLEAVQALLAHNNVDANATDNDGKTALMRAARHRRSEAVKALLAHNNVDVNATDNDGKTALMRAARHRRTEAVKALLEHDKIDVNAKTNDGLTALILAEREGHTEIAKILRDYINTKYNAEKILVGLGSSSTAVTHLYNANNDISKDNINDNAPTEPAQPHPKSRRLN